ncbi:carboxypeptidase-like regulatory domain-containing protein [Tateyamaria sp. SN6-1]|uniref:carboxypeptidase-like regulatory domain-containing protein n=1 Tax=Tateyamaria sp. SN6-1 TaxID=3092148 RepID=UPI0039F5510C
MAIVTGHVWERVTQDGRAVFKPIPEASVLYIKAQHPYTLYSVRTDQNGRYRLELPAGNYDTHVACYGYITFSSSQHPGWRIIREGPENGSNFFLEPEPKQTVFRKPATLAVRIHLPDYGGREGTTGAEQGIETVVTVDTAAGTMVLDDIPKFTNDEGVSFEAYVNTSNGTFDAGTGHATLKVNAVVDPAASLLGKNIELSNVTLSTKTELNHRSFKGFALDQRQKRFSLVGEGMTSQGRRLRDSGGILDDQRAFLRVIVTFDDLDGLT